MKRANSLQELQVELEGQVSYTAHQEFTARVLMFIAERLGDLDRVSKLEQTTEMLRDEVSALRKQTVADLDDVRHLIDERMPKIQDGRLVIEADDDQGSTVDAYIEIAETRL